MAEHQFPALIVKVDLDCDKCNKNIRKIVCKLQDPMNIRVIKYDRMNNQVILRGPFDPDMLDKKLRCCDCKCHVIKDIQIVLPEPPEPDRKPPPKPDPQPAPPVVIYNEPVVVVPEPVIVPVPEQVKEPESVRSTPPPVCCCRPCYEGYHGGCRCGSCGCSPPLIHNGSFCSDGPPGSGYPFCYCEEPSYTCSIM